MLSICGRGDNARGQCGGAAARFRQRRTLSDERHAKACGGIHAPPMRNAGRFIRPHLNWSGRRDLNPRQPAWKAGTLPLSHSRPLPSSIPQSPTQKVAAALPARFHIPSAVRRRGFNPNPPFAPPCVKTRLNISKPAAYPGIPSPTLPFAPPPPCAKNPKPPLSIRPPLPNPTDLNPQSPPFAPPPISLKIRQPKAYITAPTPRPCPFALNPAP